MIAINSTNYNIIYTIYITTIKLSDGTLQKILVVLVVQMGQQK